MTRPTLDAFHVIGDPSRRKMLMLLSADNLTINSLADNSGTVLHAEKGWLRRTARMDLLF